MKQLNLRYQEYKLALLYFRASALFNNNRLWNEADKNILKLRLFNYCYYRYLTFDLSIPIGKRNAYSVKCHQAKEYIISFFEKFTPDHARLYCNRLFGVGNWSHVLPSDYYE